MSFKNYLETSKRSRTIGIDSIAYALKKQEFRNYLDHIPRSISESRPRVGL